MAGSERLRGRGLASLDRDWKTIWIGVLRHKSHLAGFAGRTRAWYPCAPEPKGPERIWSINHHSNSDLSSSTHRNGCCVETARR